MNKKPAATVNSPKTIELMTYEANRKYISCFSIWKPSLLKAEKVVNPPQKPDASSNRHTSEECAFHGAPNTKPMIRHPTILTIKVPQGQVGGMF